MKTRKNISSRLEVLVDKKLEGTLSSEGNKELEKLLSASVAAKDYARQMEELHNSLVAAGKAKANINIEREVIEKIKEKAASPVIKKTNSFSFRMQSYNQELIKYAAILIIGLLLGSALTFLILSEISPLSKKDIGATVSSRSDQIFSFSKDSWQIQIQPLFVSDLVILVVNAGSTDSLKLNLFFDNQTYLIESTQLLSNKVFVKYMSLPDKVNFFFTGNLTAQVVLKQKSAIKTPIVMEVLKNDQIIYEKEILLP